MLDILIRGNSREKPDTSSRRRRCHRRHYHRRSPRSTLLLLTLLVETLWANLVFPPTVLFPDVSPYHLHLYRDSTVILLPCLFAHFRATSRIPRPAEYKWKFRFLRSLVYPHESTVQIYRKNLYVSIPFLPLTRSCGFFRRQTREGVELSVNEFVQFRRSV